MPRVPHTGTCRRLLPALLTLILAAALSVRAAVPLAHAEPKRIYIANDDHTDYFWSGDDVQYRAAFLAMLDYYMTQAETTAYRPSDLRGRFNCDGTLWAWEYERHKTPAEFTRLIDHLRAGTISMPLNVAALCYGGMPAEAVLRSMYYAGRLERRYGLRFPLVHAMENQTLPGGIASLWAGSGAWYSWRGVCGCASKMSWGNRPREFYRFLGPDSTGVWMKWNTKPASGYVLGGYAEAWLTTDVVNYLDSDPGFLARWPWPVSAAFGYGQDLMQSTTSQILNAATNLSNPDRRVIVSNQVDFFEDFVAHHGHQVPTFSGSFGNEWDLYSASMGAVTGAFRRGMEKLRTAEALATIASLRNPSFMTGREVARDSAFLAAGLYYEHDWTADGPVSRSRRAQFQRDMLTALNRYVNPLYDDGLAALGSAVPEPAGSERHAVFNPLSWPRTDVAELVVARPAPFRIVDVATGAEVRSQSMGPVTGGTRVRILAQDVPSVGYRVYEVLAGAGATFAPAATVSGAAIDNGIYQVTLGTRGQITSLLDRKNANRQLVDGTAQGAIHDLGFGSGTVSLESTGPVSVTLKVAPTSGGPNHDTRITLYAGLDRVDIVSNVTQNFSTNLSYRSQFALQNPVIRHEEIGMVARVARAADGGDYADENTRTDWLTFNHFVDLSQSTYGVTVSNGDSPFLQTGNSTASRLDDDSGVISAVVGMQVDGTTLGIPNQGGDELFLNRFALRTHGAYDGPAAMRFALEHQNPLVAAPLTGSAGTLPSATWSLLALSNPDVLLWALKPAEEGIGSGIIARVWNQADAPRTVTLSLPTLGIAAAKRSTHIETDLGPAPVAGATLTELLRRQQMTTWRLTPMQTQPTKPNLATSILAAAPNPARDTTRVQVSFRIRETNGIPAPVTRWAMRVDGTTVASGDTAVGAADSVLVTRLLPLLSPGSHLIRITADTLGQADESNEADNAAMHGILIRESQPPAFIAGPAATLLPAGARIDWITSEPASGRIHHGFTAALGETLISASGGVSHADTLPGTPGLRHYFRVAATDTAGNTAWSAIDSFTVTPAINTPPLATILAPQSPGYFAFGDTLHLDGVGSDAEDGSALLSHVWRVELLRPGQDPVLVFSDSLTPSFYPIPADPDSLDLSYRVRLIVADSHGLADTASVPVIPDIDLSPSAVSLSPDPPQGNVILIASFWLRNRGRMPAPPARWVLTLDGQVAAQGDAALGALDSVAINHAWPAGALAAGPHELRVVVDTLGQVTERDESNDAVTHRVEVQPGGTVGVEPGIPHELRLSAAHPNPVTESASFTLELPRAARVRIRIFDLQGRVVWSDASDRGAGVWTLRWPGIASSGARAPRGVYVARVDVADRSFRRRLVLQ